MIHIVAIMFFGIALGYLFRHATITQKTEKTISLTIITMLFILGFSIGSNPEIMNNLTTYGSQAAVIASFSMFGSILASWAVYHFFFKKGDAR